MTIPVQLLPASVDRALCDIRTVSIRLASGPMHVEIGVRSETPPAEKVMFWRAALIAIQAEHHGDPHFSFLHPVGLILVELQRGKTLT